MKVFRGRSGSVSVRFSRLLLRTFFASIGIYIPFLRPVVGLRAVTICGVMRLNIRAILGRMAADAV